MGSSWTANLNAWKFWITGVPRNLLPGYNGYNALQLSWLYGFTAFGDLTLEDVTVKSAYRYAIRIASKTTRVIRSTFTGCTGWTVFYFYGHNLRSKFVAEDSLIVGNTLEYGVIRGSSTSANYVIEIEFRNCKVNYNTVTDFNYGLFWTRYECLRCRHVRNNVETKGNICSDRNPGRC